MDEKDIQTVKDFWRKRYAERGLGVVGRVHEDHSKQTVRIVSALQSILPTETTFFEVGLDFGTGWGRMLPFLSEICGHVYAADIVPWALEQAAAVGANVSVLELNSEGKLKLPDASIDLLFSCLVIQHIVSEKLFEATTNELRRVMQPGARVVLIDNAQDQAYHVKSRPAETLAAALGLCQGWKADRITINDRPQDHWLISGVYGG